MKRLLIAVMLAALVGVAFAGWDDQTVVQVGASSEDTVLTFTKYDKAISITASVADIPIRIYPFDAAYWTLAAGETFYAEYASKIDSVGVDRSASATATLKVISFKDW